ncbi:MAG: lysylphosphatidylglycerol synthase transmembrane domain-containing protein [Nostoc sp.]|uniref:lysylphosphatidylglycerol synthase transmembrane domain-containing protein n=1 Tax=Nostoc sp. TaxID=1180 RepID=UPI002FF735E5
MKLNLISIFKLMVSIGLIVLVFTQVDIKQIWFRFQYLSFPFVFFALLYYTGCQWLSCLRWQIVLRASGYVISISSLLSSYFAGMFVSVFLPGAYGGDIYRVYRISRKIKDPEVAIASVFLERFAGLGSIFALALLGLPPACIIIGRWDIILLSFVSLGVISGGFVLIASPKLLIWAEPILNKLRLNRIAARITKIQIVVRKFLQHRQSLILAMVISLTVQFAIIYYQYLLAQQLQIPISFLTLLVFTPISVVITLLPISLGGLGVQEGLWVYLFSRVGLTADQAVLLSLTFTMLGWILSLPGSIILLLDAVDRQHIK